MKWKLGLPVLIIAALFLVTRPDENSASALESNPGHDMRTVRITVEGLKDSTMAGVSEVLLNSGASSVSFNLPFHEVVVEFSLEKTDLSKIQKALLKAHYTPSFH